MPAAAPRHVYVYYRVVADRSTAHQAVGALLEAVEAKTGIAGRLLARCDDPQTWMEVYEPVDDVARFTDALQALVSHHRVLDIAADRVRHTECFAPAISVGPAPRPLSTPLTSR